MTIRSRPHSSRAGARSRNDPIMEVAMARRLPLQTGILSLAVFLATLAQAADFSGKYQGDKLSVELNALGQGDYTGTIHLGDKQFPLIARGPQNHLEGSFVSNGNRFTFTADL